MKQNNGTAYRVLSLVICLMMLSAAAITTNHFILGHDIVGEFDMAPFAWGNTWSSLLNAKTLCTFGVVLMAAIVPMFSKNKTYRLVQLILNVAVTGFWSGMFLSFANLMRMASFGIAPLSAMLLPVILLVIAFIFPLFGKRSHYCMWVCPLGSAQELAGRLNPNHKLKMSPKTVHTLEVARDILWGVLMIMLWGGFGLSWVDYELFIAFSYNIAPLGILIAAGIVLVISVFIPRPYCRFVCPTGQFLRLAQYAPAAQKSNRAK